MNNFTLVSVLLFCVIISTVSGTTKVIKYSLNVIRDIWGYKKLVGLGPRCRALNEGDTIQFAVEMLSQELYNRKWWYWFYFSDNQKGSVNIKFKWQGQLWKTDVMIFNRTMTGTWTFGFDVATPAGWYGYSDTLKGHLSWTTCTTYLNIIARLPPVLNITGPPTLQTGEYVPHNLTQIYNYNFTDGQNITLKCSLNNTEGSDKMYLLHFYADKSTMADTSESEDSTLSKTRTFTLTKDIKLIKCVAEEKCTKTSRLPSGIVHLHYIPPIEEPPAVGSLQREWVIWVLGGSVILLTLCIAMCMAVLRCKKLTRDKLHNAVVVKDQNEAVPESKTQQKPGSIQHSKVAVENTGSQVQDSRDSDAIYSDPNRPGNNYADLYFKSDAYAEPYVKSDTYAEPYAVRGEGNYAELYAPKDLYATPVPKAQRPIVIKDDEYSNVFRGQYVNTKK